MLEKEDLDATVALVEPGSLFHVVRQCLEAGLPTFMEKPPGISLFQARSLARLSEDKNNVTIPFVVRIRLDRGDKSVDGSLGVIRWNQGQEQNVSRQSEALLFGNDPGHEGIRFAHSRK